MKLLDVVLGEFRRYRRLRGGHWEHNRARNPLWQQVDTCIDPPRYSPTVCEQW
jgi:hypothetical protein